MATLTNTQISVTYVGLLKTSANTVLTSTAQQITDGSGNNSIMFLSTAGVGIGGSPASGKELDVTGEIRVSGDVIAFHSSDKRLKDNIKLISNPLDKILKIGGYTFNWNEKQDMYNGQDIGVIAQEYEEILPDSILTTDWGVKTINTDPVVWHLVNAVKELSAKNDELVAANTALAARVTALES